MSELRECPFCGSSASLLSSAVSVVQCGNNFCALESPHYANDDTEKLIRWWNTRPASRVEEAAREADALMHPFLIDMSVDGAADKFIAAMACLRAALAAEGEEG